MVYIYIYAIRDRETQREREREKQINFSKLLMYILLKLITLDTLHTPRN
jgi:hypothetical protein